MLQVRVMPCLLSQDGRLVKTVKFKRPNYVGDPVNAIKIYNEKEVDELILLDITATAEGRGPDLQKIGEVTSECFMPLCYGGGVRDLETVRQIFQLGVEKVALNTAAVERPELVTAAARAFGNQSVVASIDVKRSLLGRSTVYTRAGRQATGLDPVEHARTVERLGAGEILLTSIDRDGTWAGYDTELIHRVASAVTIPVIACGGAGEVGHFVEAVRAGASAVAAGSMVVYQGKDLGVLINFPSRPVLTSVLGRTVA